LPEPKPDSRTGKWFALSQVGLEMVVPIFLGVWLDNRFGWAPWGTVTAATIGLVGGLFHLVYLANQIEEDTPGEGGGTP